ncbi:hypothetical protein [Thermococcus sp.]|uniref:hypothetical protein n=1 Tax=Thermococcus sp. TaxID=35749 RepID=UPI0025D6906D|nr:hypothetical protein [Thermococcus sp.]
MRQQSLIALLLGLLIVGVIGYAQATPIGGVKVVLLDENGNALTGWGKVYYTVWTFDENGSIKVLKKGTLKKKLFFSGNTIRIFSSALNEAKTISRKIDSKTTFIGVDVWIVKNGEVYTLPPDSFEATLKDKVLPETVELTFNLSDARKTAIPSAQNVKSSKMMWFEWQMIGEQKFQNVKIPVLIIHNNVSSPVIGTVDLGAYKPWGPDVTVVFGRDISKKTNFDPAVITVRALSNSITNYYAGGDEVEVPEHSWGYVWIKGTVHYIYQREYMCEEDSNDRVHCSPTGNERYFTKIDSFTITGTNGYVKDIESGSTLGMPQFSFPSRLMRECCGITVKMSNPIALPEFYGEIYSKDNGHSFGVSFNAGVPVGAILETLSGGKLPPWFATVTVGFSVSDYSSYIMLGHVKNKGPSSTVTFHAMESKYKVEIPVHYRHGINYEKVNVPVGLYVEAEPG